MTTKPSITELRSQIAVLESILREKRQSLRVAEAIESEKEELWKRHVVGNAADNAANAPPGNAEANNGEE